jgi:RHS repeat-associated protein
MSKKLVGTVALAALIAFAAKAALQAEGKPQAEAEGEVAAALACTYTIRLDSPANGATYVGPTNISLSAFATSRVDGCGVASVSFYNGTTLIANVNNPGTDRFTATWANVPLGTYTVKAVTSPGNVQASSAITVGTAPNAPPTVSMGSPTGGPFIAPATIGLSATAADSDGSIAKVDFYQGTTLIATDSAAPYTASFAASAAGSYVFTAKASDGKVTTTSSPLTVDVAANQLPSVSITSPASNATFVSPTTIPITATASDTDGSITSVNFSAPGWSSSDTSAPYTASWPTGNIGGTYSIVATAVDNKGGSRSVSVPVVLNTPTGSISASPNPCTRYTASTCSSTVTWSSNTAAAEVWETYKQWGETVEGPELFDYANKVGTGANGSLGVVVGGERLQLKYELRVAGSVVTSVLTSANWAPNVSITAPTAGQVFTAPASFTLAATATDTEGTVSKVEFYSDATKLGEDTTSPYSLSLSALGAGTYNLTAKVIDNQLAARNSAMVSVVVNALPTVTLTAPAGGTVVHAPATVNLAATAADSDGTISKVEFYNGATKLGEDTVAPYAFAWNNVLAGTYSLTAKAMDNRNGVTTSTASSIIVNAPPVVTLTSPSSGTIVNAPGVLALNATASDSDGTITKVEFYSGTTKLGEDLAAPYTFAWSDIAAGQYTLTAKATDNRGRTVTSAASSITVNGVPTVTITAPVEGAVVIAPANVLVRATTSDPDDGVAIVEFYVDGQHVATDTAAPFEMQTTNMPSGTYALMAKAYDNNGGASTSPIVTIIVNNRPSVTLTSPSGNPGILIPSQILLAATAGDSDGSISKVEFYDGSSLVGTVTTSPYQMNWLVSGAGDHPITARAYDNRGTATSSTPVVLRARSESFDLVQDAPVTSLLGELPAHDATVGRVPGEAATSGGSAAYSIPIVVPPGRRSMEPKLALGYSSRGSNGIAGMGWSLSGLSSVHRCPQTLDQDGQTRAVVIDNGDRLCLDGQRLVERTGTYGLSGTTYATELDSFARITQLGGDLRSASTYFKVELKSGDIVYYGGNSTAANAARVIPGSAIAPMGWMMERQLDRAGNLIRYAYFSTGNGENLLEAVHYTGSGATDGNRRVTLSYEDRPNQDRGLTYLAGGAQQQTQRLKTIATWVGSEKVLEYHLTYTTSASTGRSLLASVQQCAYVAGTPTCRSPTGFTWQNNALSYEFKSLRSTILADFIGIGESIERVWGGRNDYNGDGAKEFYVQVVNEADASKSGTYMVSIDADRRISGPRMRMSDDPAAVYWNKYLDTTDADYNNDGKSDRLIHGTHLKIGSWLGPLNAGSYAEAFVESETNLPFDLSHEQAYAGDFNGDGWSDIAIKHRTGASSSCSITLTLYLNQRNAAAPRFAQAGSSHCIEYSLELPIAIYEDVNSVADWNGDGLMDVLIQRKTGGLGTQIDRILLSQVNGGAYSYSVTAFASQFDAADPRTATEANPRLTWLLSDVNGDGLSDFVYARPGTTGAGLRTGYWTIRLNTGKGLSARIQTSNNGGLEVCGIRPASNVYDDYCIDTWMPRHFTKQMDVDGDGAEEILIPRRFASRICPRLYPIPNEPRYYCPEQPDLAAFEFPGGQVGPGTEFQASGLYEHGYGSHDTSAYWMDSLKFELSGGGVATLVQSPSPIISTPEQALLPDYFGNGLQDLVFRLRCSISGPAGCSRVRTDASGRVLTEVESPTVLPNGDHFLTNDDYILDNRGVGMSANGVTPQLPDLLQMVTDGLGNQTLWNYYPLSSQAGRAAGETPLYFVPGTPGARYVDERHFYFTSAMPVVSEMIRSTGTGDYRTWRYGYSEAMYHSRGRGFQGFRTVTEEDDAAGTRTVTTFHQKFPLTGQTQSIEVTSMRRPGTQGRLSLQTFTWRCDRTDRNDVTACAPPSGVATVVFPFLDTQEVVTYDATVSDDPLGGNPVILGYSQEVNADDPQCSGTYASTSGYDAYGNLMARTMHSNDWAGGGAGYRAFLDDQCQRELATFTVDTGNWWLDRLDTRTSVSSSRWNAASHALPAGASSPAQVRTVQYLWNADRTLGTETRQAGIADQQRITRFTYPVANYGLPETITVEASGDQNASRSSTIHYSADGYFEEGVVNAAGHTTGSVRRPSDGQPTLAVDANGLRVITDYDAFGLPIRVRYRGHSDAEYVAPDRFMAVTRCSLASCGAPNMAYQLATVQDGSPTALMRYDMLDRPRLAAQRQMDGVWTNLWTEYNRRGLVERKSEPRRTGAPITSWTEFPAYDVLGRVTRKITPKQSDDGRGNLVTNYRYVGRQTIIEVCGSADADASRCTTMSRTTDALGRYVETVDALGGRTRYWYDGLGNIVSIEDANGQAIQARYNALGRRVFLDDPNQGQWDFRYNALGELLEQRDARNIQTLWSYDTLGRTTRRTSAVDINADAVTDDIVDTWTYDPVGSLGKLATTRRTINGAVERASTLGYDGLARVRQHDISQAMTPSGTASYRMRQKYDVYYGRITAQEYPNGETVELLYSAYGHATSEREPATGETYRTLGSTNARGQPLSEAFGNAIEASYEYADASGQVKTLAHRVGGNDVRRMEYDYDVFGNLTHQGLNGSQTDERFQYDFLHRLVLATRTGAASGTIEYGYDAVGNITHKSDLSVIAPDGYRYTSGTCGGGPNAVKQVRLASGGTRSQCYDANGNLTADSSGLSVYYDHENLPNVVQRGAMRDEYRYDAGGERTRSWGADGSRVYLTGYEHRIDTTETKVYLGDYAVITRTGSTRKVEYLLKDRLGSIGAVATPMGTLTETRGYDAFGKPRSGQWSDLSPARLQSTATTARGFTQHEHMNQLELIHMKGRIYDYQLGRFLSVDPIIGSPLNSQALNPYSYVMNNPLAATDPTGYRCQVETGSRICGVDTGAAGGLVGSRTSSRIAREGGQKSGATTSQGPRQQSATPASDRDVPGRYDADGSGELGLLSVGRDPVLTNSCNVQPLAGCRGITKEGIEKHVNSDDGYNDRDGKPNPLVTAGTDDKGRLVLTIPYFVSGERNVARQAMRNATSEFKRVGVVLDFAQSEDRANAVEIRGVRSSEFITDLKGSNGAPMACDCEGASRIGGWVPNYRQAYINADPVTGVLERSTGAHELGGHLLGLAHRRTGIMPKTGGDSRRPDSNDAQRLRNIYMPGGD